MWTLSKINHKKWEFCLDVPRFKANNKFDRVSEFAFTDRRERTEKQMHNLAVRPMIPKWLSLTFFVNLVVKALTPPHYVSRLLATPTPSRGGTGRGHRAVHSPDGGHPYGDLIPRCLVLHDRLEFRSRRTSDPDELCDIASVARDLMEVVRLAGDGQHDAAQFKFKLASGRSRELIELFGPIKV